MPGLLTRAAGLALVAAMLGACPGDPGPRQPDASRETSPSSEPVRGGTLSVLLASDVDSLDPHRAARPSSWWFARALHRGLYAFPDAAGTSGSTPIPDLAEALPTFSSDGLTATVRLREGVRFADERVVTAAAVRSSLQRLMRTGVGIAPHLVPRAGVPGGIDAVEAVDERTVRLRLARAANDLVWLLAHPQAAILPSDIPRGVVAARRVAGSGPYRLATYQPERRILLERNPAWDHETDPVRDAWVDVIDARIGVDGAEARADVATGLADVIVDPGPPDAPIGRLPEGARVEHADPGCTRYLFTDPRVAPLARRPVRLAVAHALDRETFVRGTADLPAPRSLPPTVLGSTDDPVLAEDLPRARALLAREDLEDGFTVQMTVGDSSRDRRDASRVRSALARAGIRVRIRTVPPASLYPLYYSDPNERLALGIATWCADWPGRAGRSMLVPLADPSRLGEQRVPARPGTGAASRRAIDAALRAEGALAATRWSAADATMISTGILIPLAWPRDQIVLGRRVGGWSGSPMFPRGDPAALWVGAGSRS